MAKTFIRVQGFESETPAAEENLMLDRVVYSREQFSFQMCLEGGDGSRTFKCQFTSQAP